MKSSIRKNVFVGENAILDFVNPDNCMTPLVEIPNEINPFSSDKVRFFAKLLQSSPLNQIKSIPAYEMLIQAKKNNLLKNKNTIVEASSGNTSYGLSVISRLLSIENAISYVSNEISPKKLRTLLLFGIKPTVFVDPLCADASDPESRIYKAREAGKKDSVYNPGQYFNKNNPLAHQKYTSNQIWKQTDGKISVFCSGLGTSGTFSGCSKFLKNKNPNIHCICGLRSENNMVPGLRTKEQMSEIDFPWKEYADAVLKIGSKDSYKNSLNLIRYGIIAGPSSGLAFGAAKKYVGKLKKKKQLDKLRNDKGEINVVFICCDLPYLYLDEYFQYLDESHFPKIENKDLLLNNSGDEEQMITEDGFEVSPEKAYKMIYNVGKDTLWKSIKNNSEINVNDKVMVIDVRKKSDFEHFHLAGSINIEFDKLISKPKKYLEKMKVKRVIVICNLGMKSNSITRLLRKKGIDAYSLHGGVTEWSNLDLPRWKPDICFEK